MFKFLAPFVVMLSCAGLQSNKSYSSVPPIPAIELPTNQITFTIGGEDEKPIDLDAPIAIEGMIDSELADKVIKQIEHQAKSKKEIPITINSTGGSVDDGRRIINAMLASPAKSVCLVSEWALSDAAVIFEEGCTIRNVYSTSILMMHQPATEGKGQLRDFANIARRLQAISFSIESGISARTNGKLSVEDIDKHISGGKEWWINSADIMKLNLADHLIKSRVEK